MSRRLPLLLGALLVTLLLAPVLAPGRTLVFRDALPLAVAHNDVIHDALVHGRLPEWDPSQYAGIPFLAGPQTAALYPPRMLAALKEARERQGGHARRAPTEART